MTLKVFNFGESATAVVAFPVRNCILRRSPCSFYHLSNTHIRVCCCHIVFSAKGFEATQCKDSQLLGVWGKEGFSASRWRGALRCAPTIIAAKGHANPKVKVSDFTLAHTESSAARKPCGAHRGTFWSITAFVDATEWTLDQRSLLA